MELTEKNVNAATRTDKNQSIINLIKLQLKEAHDRNKSLESNLSIALKNNTKISVINKEKENDESQIKPNEINQPKVVLLHDSLCGKVNETILSRENISTKKVWAPNINDMNKKLDEIENVDVVVIQALTRNLSGTSINDIEKMIKETTTKASTKAKKVIISTIVGREDSDMMKMKAEVLNASIKYTYYNDPNVFICDNDNLKDKKFRENDGIHLTQHGISVLATNLKYKIAEALNITVAKKNRGRPEYNRSEFNRTEYRRKFYDLYD